MVDEAKQHESEDARKRELIDARNQADNMVYLIEKELREKGVAVPSDLRGEAESAVNQLKSASASDETKRIQSLTEQANQILARIQQSGSEGPSNNGHHKGETPEGEVVEGDFKDA